MKEKLLTQEKIIAREWEIYHQSFDDSKVESDISIFNRQIKVFEEYDFNMPQTIFYVENNDMIVVGRKTISDLYINHKLKSINCSKITNNMLLGILSSSSYKNRKIKIQYYPFTNREKEQYFENIKNNTCKYDLYYPFHFKYFDSNMEQTSNNLDWKIDDEIANYLSIGEKHIRDYTINIIDKYKLKPKIVYDPACSTGKFLLTIKNKLPLCKTIGHDMSKEMVEYSRKNVDESACYNAFNSPLKNESVDMLILRFLNGGVVSTNDAELLFDSLIKKVKKNGYIICIGHTPVLIKRKKFKNNNLELLEKIGYDNETNSIFQYYFAKRK